MMVNKGLKVILSIVIAWSLLTPFNIHADETVNTAPFLGFNVQITGYGENMSSIQIPKINFSYAGNTVPSGYISGKLNCTSPSTPTSSSPCDIFSLTNNNGGYSDLQGLKVVFPLQSYFLDANGNAIINHQSYFFIDYEFILDDNYKGYVVITSSDNIAHTIYVNGNNFHYETFTQDPANPLTFTITDYSLTRVINSFMWSFPIESLGAINTLITARKNDVELIDFFNNTYYQYPIFNIPNSSLVINQSGWKDKGTYYYLIFGIDKPITYDNVSDYFTFTNCHMVEFTYLQDLVNLAYKIVKIKLINDNGMSFTVSSASSFKYMPIYFNNIDNKYLSTDFALQFGLRNKLLDDLDLIANGTTASSSAAQSNDSANSQLTTKSNQLFTQEDSFKSDMNNAMQNIPSFSVNNFGSKFMSSATWVRQQYERMTNNTPFQQVITFSLLVGLSMILIGKVRK